MITPVIAAYCGLLRLVAGVVLEGSYTRKTAGASTSGRPPVARIAAYCGLLRLIAAYCTRKLPRRAGARSSPGLPAVLLIIINPVDYDQSC